MVNKKGAMFGLDARIALAIFGALSVISGAALYSAIQQANAVAMYQNLLEFGKGVESYYLDTGHFIYRDSNTSTSLKSINLIENTYSENTWNGPYVEGEASLNYIKTSYTKKISSNAVVKPFIFKASEWAASGSDFCLSSKKEDCAFYIGIYTSHSPEKPLIQNIFTILDKVYDNSDGGDKGNIRDCAYSGAALCIKYMSIRRENLPY